MQYFSSQQLVALFLCASIWVSTLFGQEHFDSVNSNWPTIRGPALNGQSLETGLAESWPKSGPPVLWTRELGQGSSTEGQNPRHQAGGMVNAPEFISGDSYHLF